MNKDNETAMAPEAVSVPEDAKRSGGKKTSGGKKASGKKNLSRRQKRARILKAKIIALIILVVLIVVGISSLVKSCTVSHKTPESVSKALVESYVKGSQRKIRKCYGVKKADEELQQEIDATIQYFEAHASKDLMIDDCGVIYEDGDYTYVYVTYELVLEDDQSYPCISTYMTQNKDGEYYVLTNADITDEMSATAAEKYAEFMTTDAYKTYAEAYDNFIGRNPAYEEEISAKLS